jgi:hypothetical protein
MTRGAARSRTFVGSAGLLVACISNEPRPAPPLLSLTLAKATVHSPDTLNGTVGANDPDGLDSVWLTVAFVSIGNWDGRLATEFTQSFRVLIGPGFSAGDRLPVHLKGRDLAGFVSEMDTAVRVGP